MSTHHSAPTLSMNAPLARSPEYGNVTTPIGYVVRSPQLFADAFHHHTGGSTPLRRLDWAIICWYGVCWLLAVMGAAGYLFVASEA